MQNKFQPKPATAPLKSGLVELDASQLTFVVGGAKPVALGSKPVALSDKPTRA